MNGDVLSVEGAKWELFEEITLAEAVTSVERTLDSEVKGAMVVAQIPKATVTNESYFRCIKGYTNVTVGVGLSPWASGERYIKAQIFTQDDVWNGHGYSSSVGSYSTVTGIVNPHSVITEEQMSGIETLRFYTFGEGFPVDTNIKFYVLRGVRA